MINFSSRKSSDQPHKTKLDYKIIRNATIVLIVFIIPMSYSHEIGHAIICASEGNLFQINMSLNNASLVCLGTLENIELFYVFGGFFAMSLALIPFVKYSWMINHKWAVIVSLSFAIGHGINAVIEWGLTLWYLEKGLGPELLMNMTSFFVYFALLVYFGRKNE